MPRPPSPVVYYVLFFLSGISVMMLSVLLPQLHAQVSDAQVGRLLAAQFTGQLLGPLVAVRKTRLSLMCGLLLTTVAAAAIGAGGVPAWWLLFLYGLGMGIAMTATNIRVGEEAPADARASRIELLNAFWPLGAACASLCLRLVNAATPLRVYWLIAGGSAVALIAVALRRRQQSNAEDDARTVESSLPHLLRLSLLAALAIGLESSLSNWSPTFAARYVGSPHAAGTASTVFWVGVLVGRSGASMLLQRVRWSAFALGCALLSVLATLAVAASSGVLLYVAVFLAALGAAPVYPVIISRCLALRGKSAIFVSAGIGSAAMPWLIGTLSLRGGSLRLSMLASTAAATLLLLALMKERAAEPA